eukprot:s1237_g13.t1
MSVAECSLSALTAHGGFAHIAARDGALQDHTRFAEDGIGIGIGSLLDSLRYAQFVSEDDHGSGATEGRQGVPRFNGDASRLNEWTFRVRLLEKKEHGLSETEQQKLGRLSLRLIEGLSGQALKVAQQLELSKLDATKGLDYLIEAITNDLRPRRMQQARELYEAGAQQGGMLSRQHTESMANYILRRKTWYRAMLDLSSDLKLPDVVLCEQLLLNSGLDENQRLMIRTVVGEKMDFDRVAQELINQHPNIHARGNLPFNQYRRNDFRGFQRPGFPKGNPKGFPKGFRGKPRYQAAFFAEEEDPTYLEAHDETYLIEDPGGAHEDYRYDEHEVTGYFSENDIGTYAEEHLAFLTEHGLDTEDPEACEFASEIIQAEQDAYYARKGASTKGHGGFQKGATPPFEISGQISLDDKRERLRALKARTTCKKCGAVGHWSGDFECPLSKGKGRKGGGKSSSITTTSGAGTSQHRGGAGRGPKGRPSARGLLFFHNRGRNKPPVRQPCLPHAGNTFHQHGRLVHRFGTEDAEPGQWIAMDLDDDPELEEALATSESALVIYGPDRTAGTCR